MDCKEIIEVFEVSKHNAQALFRLNHTMPMTDEYTAALHDLFGDNIGKNCIIVAPVQGVCLERVTIGNNAIPEVIYCLWHAAESPSKTMRGLRQMHNL